MEKPDQVCKCGRCRRHGNIWVEPQLFETLENTHFFLRAWTDKTEEEIAGYTDKDAWEVSIPYNFCPDCRDELTREAEQNEDAG